MGELHLDGFIPIQRLDIEAQTQITFDLYVNLPLNQKCILYRRKGGSVGSDRLAALSENNVRNFFIHKEDYQEFVKYVASRIKMLIGSVDTEENRRLMTNAARSILASTISEDSPAVTNALMANLNDITQNIIESILETSSIYNKRTFQRFAELAQRGTHFHKHPLNVCSLMVLISVGIGYSNEKILSDIAMASLLHDVGLSKLPQDIILKAHTPDALGTHHRQKLYEHPRYTIEILKERKVQISPLAEIIILQHHEEFNGFGYPKGIRGYNINEFAQILRVADELEMIIQNGFSTVGQLKKQVLGLLDTMHKEKIIEPTLSDRIRSILI
jgi:HD-GYP domain-containing protein (c-di-GMP phosphodiesterase class II)